ncbi:hypothetical protein [Parahaliea aestuarii]|uniref:hypothetical protein n=1 Tax=Parahaliea aestuarii TaxID=1852021 RepID=UPI00164F09DB|nr:hypothetical protein [Parahaliea aestuarii]
MKRYRFEVREELITPIEVMADSEQEAREGAFRQDRHVTPFDTIHGDIRLVLRSVDDN